MQNAERIDQIIGRLLPDIEARLMKPNAEVTAAILACGWTRASEPVARMRVAGPRLPLQYELRV